MKTLPPEALTRIPPSLAPSACAAAPLREGARARWPARVRPRAARVGLFMRPRSFSLSPWEKAGVRALRQGDAPRLGVMREAAWR